jgi:hypothetical protein
MVSIGDLKKIGLVFEPEEFNYLLPLLEQSYTCEDIGIAKLVNELLLKKLEGVKVESFGVPPQVVVVLTIGVRETKP